MRITRVKVRDIFTSKTTLGLEREDLVELDVLVSICWRHDYLANLAHATSLALAFTSPMGLLVVLTCSKLFIVDAETLHLLKLFHSLGVELSISGHLALDVEIVPFHS